MSCLRRPLSNGSSAALRPLPHGSWPGWFTAPALYDSRIRDFMPVYPDAFQSFPLRQPRARVTDVLLQVIAAVHGAPEASCDLTDRGCQSGLKQN